MGLVLAFFLRQINGRMARPRSFYDVLNVAPEAEPVVIEAAYRALMKKYHPDQGPAAPGGASVAEINEAYALLRDPDRRADYDHREWARQQSVRLAAYPPLRPPPRRSAFGWTGWIVALVLGGVVALMASRADGVASRAVESETARAAPDYRSQPSPPDLPAAAPATVRAPPEPLAPAAAEPAAARAELSAVEAPAVPRLAPERSLSPPRRVRPRPRARPPAPAADDRDFLEREGYIY
jgi:curved DNA-binding protein CbpA